MRYTFSLMFLIDINREIAVFESLFVKFEKVALSLSLAPSSKAISDKLVPKTAEPLNAFKGI